MHIEVIGNGMILKTQWIGYTNQEGASAIQRIGVIRNEDTWEPVQYGPVFPSTELDMVLCAIVGMDPIMECDGCMSGFHPGHITITTNGSRMCPECLEIEGYEV